VGHALAASGRVVEKSVYAAHGRASWCLGRGQARGRAGVNQSIAARGNEGEGQRQKGQKGDDSRQGREREEKMRESRWLRSLLLGGCCTNDSVGKY
jgi:hypothetical protein